MSVSNADFFLAWWPVATALSAVASLGLEAFAEEGFGPGLPVLKNRLNITTGFDHSRLEHFRFRNTRALRRQGHRSHEHSAARFTASSGFE